MIRVLSVVVLGVAGSVLAQPAITIEVENPVLLPGESTVVRLWAGFDPGDYAMARVATDLVTSVGSEGWSDAALIAPMRGSGTQPGDASATGYDLIIAGQLHFPVGAGIIADPTNPIAFWQATYTAPVDPAAPFVVDLFTESVTYDVYITRMESHSESRLGELTEGSAAIRVIPAPGAAVVLGFGVVALRRRR